MTEDADFAVKEESYGAVWHAARNYMRARKNDIHIPISFDFAKRLSALQKDADRTVVLVAIILHDIGWSAIDEGEILSSAFGPNMRESEVRILHEKEGVRLARPLLQGLKFNQSTIAEICQIIDGHDTRPHALSLNDSLVKDADKLWRFTVPGVAIACDWFKMTPTQYMDRLETGVVPQLFTGTATVWAHEELAASRRLLQSDKI